MVQRGKRTDQGVGEKIDAFCERLKKMGKISVDRSLYV